MVLSRFVLCFPPPPLVPDKGVVFPELDSVVDSSLVNRSLALLYPGSPPLSSPLHQEVVRPFLTGRIKHKTGHYSYEIAPSNARWLEALSPDRQNLCLSFTGSPCLSLPLSASLSLSLSLSLAPSLSVLLSVFNPHITHPSPHADKTVASSDAWI
ncbi:hypothetical protein L249_4350 [Ophiocordyceps polyrhachis-furcata BCC 54312]|uniref:Uncharacterized protein n=1 Tax=Ophiocordyceps polyrhachis-furcata BCC 54312 TaxID=1330021 RepID=A0A367L7L0_9HYPO|nr:hypothetical protein L249_4350 [Ophiocordyceps polyrhachis-furcata BCC 54312]